MQNPDGYISQGEGGIICFRIAHVHYGADDSEFMLEPGQGNPLVYLNGVNISEGRLFVANYPETLSLTITQQWLDFLSSSSRAPA